MTQWFILLLSLNNCLPGYFKHLKEQISTKKIVAHNRMNSSKMDTVFQIQMLFIKFSLKIIFWFFVPNLLQENKHTFHKNYMLKKILIHRCNTTPNMPMTWSGVHEKNGSWKMIILLNTTSFQYTFYL